MGVDLAKGQDRGAMLFSCELCNGHAWIKRERGAPGGVVERATCDICSADYACVFNRVGELVMKRRI